MTVSMNDSPLFRGMFTAPAMCEIFDDTSIIQAWMDIWKALAQTQAEHGIIPKEAAEEITKKCDYKNLDMVQIGQDIIKVGHALVPVLRAYEHTCENGYGEFLHLGSTTQDISDTGFMLLCKRAYIAILKDMRDVEAAAMKLAADHKNTVMAGRTHGQQALPITFGFKAAYWADEIRREIERMKIVLDTDFVGEISGAVGTCAGFGKDGHIISDETMKKLGLNVPTIMWHSTRDRWAQISNTAVMAAFTMSHIAHECANMMKTEFGEVAEGFVRGQVFSSTMPNKRNPGLCEMIQTQTRLAQGSAIATINSMYCEHERDASVWRIEWRSLSECLLSVGTAVARAKKLLEGLQVNADRMRENLNLTKGLMFGEPVMLALGKSIGKQTAHELVYEISMDCFEKDVPFIDGLMANETVAKNMTREQLLDIMQPEQYTGDALYYTEKALAACEAARAKDPEIIK